MNIAVFVVGLLSLIENFLVLDAVHQHVREYLVDVDVTLRLWGIRGLHKILVEGDSLEKEETYFSGDVERVHGQGDPQDQANARWDKL